MGLNIDYLGIDKFYDRLEAVASALKDKLHLSWLSYLIYPFVVFIEWIAGFRIDFGAIEVTCVGSQAPMELIINCLILAAVVVIIESQASLYLSLIFGDMNLKVATTLYHFKLLKTWKSLAFLCTVSSINWFIF